MSEGEAKPRAARKADQRTESDRLRAALGRPFHPNEVKWKPQTVSKDGTRAMAVAYIDARAVQDRLDEVVGPDRWQTQIVETMSGVVLCRLSLKLEGEWVAREDFGSESDQPDPQDKRKAAASDALKRAAVQWGIGRYLYRLPKVWVPYDKQKRQLLQTPRLPEWAMPGFEAELPPPAQDEPEPAEEPQPQPQPDGQRPQAPSPVVPAPPPRSPAEKPFHVMLQEYDAKLAGRGVCKAGDLVKHVAAAGRKAGFDPDMTRWGKHEIGLARAVTQEFEAARQAAA